MKTDFEIAVIGGGPAGLTAAVYAARAGHTVTILEGAACGGQMLLAHEIENYPGFTKIAGYALADQMMEQANSLGVSITYAQVDSVTKEDDHFTVLCGSKSFTASAVIVAAGAKHRTLDVPGEAEFIGRGVSYCAVCDGRFFAGKDVAVVGGGNTALGDAIYLSNICNSVTLIHRRDTFRGNRQHSNSNGGTSNEDRGRSESAVLGFCFCCRECNVTADGASSGRCIYRCWQRAGFGYVVRYRRGSV